MNSPSEVSLEVGLPAFLFGANYCFVDLLHRYEVFLQGLLVLWCVVWESRHLKIYCHG